MSSELYQAKEDMSNYVSGLISEATVFNRAYVHLKNALAQLNAKRRKSVDRSYNIACEYLNVAMELCDRAGDEAWSEVYKHSKPTDDSVERLCRAVMVQAAQDYEKDLCMGGKADLQDAEDIERFAASGDSHFYSSVDFVAILRRIKDTIPIYNKFINEHGAEIVEDTNWLRHHRKLTHEDAKFKCPLCGGGLYYSGRPIDGTYLIKCSGCNMEGWYHAKTTD